MTFGIDEFKNLKKAKIKLSFRCERTDISCMSNNRVQSISFVSINLNCFILLLSANYFFTKKIPVRNQHNWQANGYN